MIFKKSYTIKIKVSEEQEKQLSSIEKIAAKCKDSNVIAFDIYNDNILIGFAMLREYEKGGYFLWNFAIDSKYQNNHYGTVALKELIVKMETEYNMHTMTTTYKHGNEHAKHIYNNIGFIETDIVNENGIHEVNMIYLCK